MKVLPVTIVSLNFSVINNKKILLFFILKKRKKYNLNFDYFFHSVKLQQSSGLKLTFSWK